jgi:hypothetical protein
MPDTYKSFGTILSGTTAATTIYSGVVGTAVVNSINIANANEYYINNVTIEMVKGSTAYMIIDNAQLPVSTALQVLDAPMVLDSGNTLRATAGYTYAAIHIITSVLEIT